MDAPATQATEILLERIQPSRTNPRKTFREEGLADLAESIKTYGVMQPILLRPAPPAPTDPDPFYEIIAGERRYRASKLAGRTTIPAVVREISDMEVLELQIIENLQREDLHPLEEAESYEALLAQHKADPDYSVDQVAAKLGKSRAYIYARLKLCALRPAARDAFYAGTLNASTALLLARIPVPELQDKALKEITEPGWQHDHQPMSFRAAQKHVQENYMTRLDQAPFKLTDETLLPEAGPCTTCPKRTGANPDLFDDVGRADVCTDPVCFAAKKEAFRARARSTAIARGKTVISGKAAEKIKPHRYSEMKGYLDVNDSPWWMGSEKKIKNALGKSLPETVLIEDPHTGDLVEAIPEEAARTALKAAGVTVSRAGSQSSASDREKEKKAKAERTYRRALLAEIHRNARAHFAADGKFTLAEMREIAFRMYREIGHDLRPTIAALWAWPAQDLDAVGRLVHQLDVPELALLMLMCIRAPSTYCSHWSSSFATPDKLLQACAQYGVDPKEVKARVQPPTVKPRAAKLPVRPIMYRDPDTAATWSGRGKPPRWITAAEESGRARTEFLVEQNQATPVEPPPAPTTAISESPVDTEPTPAPAPLEDAPAPAAAAVEDETEVEA